MMPCGKIKRQQVVFSAMVACTQADIPLNHSASRRLLAHLAFCWVLLLAGASAQGTNTPAPQKSLMLSSLGEAEAFKLVPFDVIDRVEERIRMLAITDARYLASIYAKADPVAYPGLAKFGQQLTGFLGTTGRGFDFSSVVSRNPAFWQAEREMSAIDVSLPYLISMLAVLGGDRPAAARLIALAQATLPLTPSIRRAYAQPEALMIFKETLLTRGLPMPARLKAIEDCQAQIDIIKRRIGKWPDSMLLQRALIDFTLRRAELLVKNGSTQDLMDESISDALGLTPLDLKFAKRNDAIWAYSVHDSLRSWSKGGTLVQQWARWNYDNEPAEIADVEQSIAAYEGNGRPDLAWLTWRHTTSLRGMPVATDKERWKGWLHELIGADAAMRILSATDSNRFIGTASCPIPFEGRGEAWSGDIGIHPLLAVKIERDLAFIDVVFAQGEPDSRSKMNLYLRRAEILCDIGATAPSRRQLEVLTAMRDDFDKDEKLARMLIRAIEATDARLLKAEGRFKEAEAYYLRKLKEPTNAEIIRHYADLSYAAGNHEKSRALYLQLMDLTAENGAYWAIMSDLAARRNGVRELAGLKKMQQIVAKDSWEAAGIKFSLGEITADELLDTANKSGKIFTSIQHECEGAFWASQVALSEGRMQDGIYWLRRCMATGFVTFLEYSLAKAELERLSPEKKPPRQEGEGRDSFGVQPA